jgi:hypothetical protein
VGLLAVRETLGHGNRITPRSAFPQGDGSPGERACYHALLGVPTTMLWEATSSVAKAAPLTHPRVGGGQSFLQKQPSSMYSGGSNLRLGGAGGVPSSSQYAGSHSGNDRAYHGGAAAAAAAAGSSGHASGAYTHRSYLAEAKKQPFPTARSSAMESGGGAKTYVRGGLSQACVLLSSHVLRKLTRGISRSFVPLNKPWPYLGVTQGGLGACLLRGGLKRDTRLQTDVCGGAGCRYREHTTRRR